MPKYRHTDNTKNGNSLAHLTASLLKRSAGRTTNLGIYEIYYLTFRNSGLAGPNFDEIVKSITKAGSSTHQKTNHNDELGNLPVGPGSGVEYREYFLDKNGFHCKGDIRLVADLKNKRLYLTPTHYEVWLQEPQAAQGADTSKLIDPTTQGARNPFFLLSQVRIVNDLFD